MSLIVGFNDDTSKKLSPNNYYTWRFLYFFKYQHCGCCSRVFLCCDRVQYLRTNNLEFQNKFLYFPNLFVCKLHKNKFLVEFALKMQTAIFGSSKSKMLYSRVSNNEKETFLSVGHDKISYLTKCSFHFHLENQQFQNISVHCSGIFVVTFVLFCF